MCDALTALPLYRDLKTLPLDIGPAAEPDSLEVIPSNLFLHPLSFSNTPFFCCIPTVSPSPTLTLPNSHTSPSPSFHPPPLPHPSPYPLASHLPFPPLSSFLSAVSSLILHSYLPIPPSVPPPYSPSVPPPYSPPPLSSWHSSPSVAASASSSSPH
ncbi:uncharacterized protein [Macrobrachium rosenbergii]|uniref:uncharacterized protein n=1 Tax=Macrobrachium rosenbergii TaxID=79674 RepID=UPI0034D51E6B